MTPDQIFKAERALRELNQIRSTLTIFGSFVFAGTVEPVVSGKTKLDFPMCNTDLSKLLRDEAKTHLIARAEALERVAAEMGVVFAEPGAS